MLSVALPEAPEVHLLFLPEGHLTSCFHRSAQSPARKAPDCQGYDL